METWSVVMGGVLVAFLVVYSLTGGADYGGGVWDLLARGKRAEAQRDLVKRAIGPIWEANHVWLIAIVVVLFANFPLAFSTLSKALHLPLTALLFGIVLRGSAFVFRTYDKGTARDKWSLVFSISSTITPVMLGVCLGALSVGRIRIDGQGRYLSNYTEAWWQPFPFMVGLFTLSLFAFLAAVYLAEFAAEEALQEDFRQRGLIAGVVVGVLAIASLGVASFNAPSILEGLTQSAWAIPLHLLAAFSACGTLWCLWKRYFRPARFLCAAQVALVILGWAFAQYPYLVWPSITIAHGTAPETVLKQTFLVLLGGSVLLVPSFLYLFKLFGRDR